MGLGRFIVVAETDADAQAIARRAYPRWQRELHASAPQSGPHQCGIRARRHSKRSRRWGRELPARRRGVAAVLKAQIAAIGF